MTATIALNEPIFVFTSGLSFSEFVQQLEPGTRTFLRRRYELIRLPIEDQATFVEHPNWIYLILLALDETPDVFMVTPILQRIVEAGPRLDLRIIADDTDMALLNEVVDDDLDLEAELSDLDMPVLFLFDEDWNQVGQWGPRPQEAEERLEAWLAEHPQYETLLGDEEPEDSEELDRLVEKLICEMRIWYNDDLAAATVAEIRRILEAAPTDAEDD